MIGSRSTTHVEHGWKYFKNYLQTSSVGAQHIHNDKRKLWHWPTSAYGSGVRDNWQLHFIVGGPLLKIYPSEISRCPIWALSVWYPNKTPFWYVRNRLLGTLYCDWLGDLPKDLRVMCAFRYSIGETLRLCGAKVVADFVFKSIDCSQYEHFCGKYPLIFFAGMVTIVSANRSHCTTM